MTTVYYLLDCNHGLVGNPVGYKTESVARAVANNPKSKAHMAIKKAWQDKLTHMPFLENRYQNYDMCYQIENFNR